MHRFVRYLRAPVEHEAQHGTRGRRGIIQLRLGDNAEAIHQSGMGYEQLALYQMILIAQKESDAEAYEHPSADCLGWTVDQQRNLLSRKLCDLWPTNLPSTLSAEIDSMQIVLPPKRGIERL